MNNVVKTCKYVYVFVSSVSLMHPAKAVGRNEVPFGRDTGVVPNNTVLEKGPGHPAEGEIWGVGTPSSQ